MICTDCLLTLPSEISSADQRELLTKFEALLPLEQGYSMYRYQKSGIVKELMQSMKYGGDQALAVRLGQMFGRKIQEKQNHPADVIVPVPLHPRKLKSRGFNQSMLLSQGLAEVLAIEVLDALRRVTDNPTQTRKSKVERIENTKGLFILNPDVEIKKGTHILLVDDTLTTGSTIRAAGEVLVKEIDCRITVAVLALAK